MAEGARRNPPPEANPLRVLVEIGFMGGRAGARDRTDALAGRARGRRQPPASLSRGSNVSKACCRSGWGRQAASTKSRPWPPSREDEGLLPAGAPMVLSAGGSAFFDRVGERFAAVAFGRPVLQDSALGLLSYP